MKLISVSMGDECIKNPRCSFCYLRDKHREFKYWKIVAQLDNFEDNVCVVSFEYNGHNLGLILSDICCSYSKLTMTTMPQVITNTLCGALKVHNITAISLSYDSEKVENDADYIEKINIIKSNGIKACCNFLIEKIPTNINPDILKSIDQLNLLTLKPTGKLTGKELKIIELEIEYYKSILPVAVDNCLGVQLGFIDDCKRGKDFIHISPDGTVEECCFKNDCFLYK